MPLIQVDGVELHYRLDGPTNGPVLVMSNSLSTTVNMWDGQMPALADKYRVLRWEKRGHGGSGVTPPPYTLDTLMGDLRDLLRGLGIESAHCLGLSTGGAIAQLFAMRHPEMVRALVLCDTSSYVPADVWDGRIQNALDQGMNAVADASMERWFTPAFRAQNPQVVAYYWEMVSRTHVDGYVGCASALKQRILPPLLKTISAPTLIIVGADDPSTPVAHSEILHREIAGSEMVIIDDAAHLSNVAQPAIFNRALRAFLDRH